MPEAKSEYSITDVKKAGKILRKPRHRTELRWAFNVFESWRNRHSVPLTQFHDSLQEYVRLASPLTLVAHRPKRIEAVMNKLLRDPKAQLSTMQDIAGCRAIVKSIEDVEPFIEACKSMWSNHILHKVYPYIEEPNRRTGYRGVHLVYKYQSDNELFNNRLIEIQIRTREQHAWATAVETFDVIERQSLKSGDGDPTWQRFFTLMSSAIAHREASPIVPDTPIDRSELENELRHYSTTLQVKRRLMTYGAIAKSLNPRYEGVSGYSGYTGEFGFFVIDLDVNSERVEIRGYGEDDLRKAYLDVIEAEREHRNVVLAAARDVEQLKEAYPNWFIDTHNFLMVLQRMLGEDVHIDV